MVYKKKNSLGDLVNSLTEKGIKEEFEEDLNILLQLILENVEENWLLKELTSLIKEKRKTSFKVTYNPEMGEQREKDNPKIFIIFLFSPQFFL